MENQFSRSRASFLLGLLLVAAAAPSSPAQAQLGGASSYPVLPDLPGADIYGQSRVTLHLDQGVPLVEVDGQLYALGERPLELAIDVYGGTTLLFVVPDDAGLYVTEQGLLVDELDPTPRSNTLAFDLSDPSLIFGFELALPGQPAPTVPELVILPTQSDPPPA